MLELRLDLQQGAVSKHFSNVNQIADISDRGQPRPPAPQANFLTGNRGKTRRADRGLNS
jgi:hypothetical protein